MQSAPRSWGDAQLAPGEIPLLIGTETHPGGSQGIYNFALDPATGDLRQTGLAAPTESPTFFVLAPDGRHLYAVSEVTEFAGKPGGAVVSFAFDPATGRLTRRNAQPTGGASPTHVAIDSTGRSVFVANYGGGSVASFLVGDDGTLSPAVSFFQYTGHGPNPDRQATPHAHRVTVSPDNGFLFVNDLGLDRIHAYTLDPATATLTPAPHSGWTSAPGAGPRALRFDASGRCACCITEMASTVNVLRWDAAAGTLQQVQELHLVPPDNHSPTRGTDIVFTRDGRFAYVANRDINFMAAFSVSPADGTLTPLGPHTTCGGKTPRHFALSPDDRWLLVANQDSDTVSVIARDPSTGLLADTARDTPLAKPMCIVFP